MLSLDINSLTAEAIATGDTFVFNDSGDNGLHKETVDDLFTIGPALVSEVALNLSQDYLLFLDGGASGDAKKDSLVDLVAAMAGAGLAQNASTGKLEVQGNAVALKGDGDTLAEGYNYFADSSSNLGVDLPAAPASRLPAHLGTRYWRSAFQLLSARPVTLAGQWPQPLKVERQRVFRSAGSRAPSREVLH